LKSVKVVSKDPEMSEEELKQLEDMRERVRNRLPQSREGAPLPLHAFIEPENVPKGRVSLFSALKFINKHTKSPREFNAEAVAKQHNMNVEDVKNIVMYFKLFYEENSAKSNEKYGTEQISYFSIDRVTDLLKSTTKQTVHNQQIESNQTSTSTQSSTTQTSSTTDSKVNHKKDEPV